MNLNVANDATFNGATVTTTQAFNADIGGDLSVESVQDTASSRSNNFSASAGLSFGGKTTDHVGSRGVYQTSAVGKANGVGGVSGSLGQGSGYELSQETVVTRITSQGTADVTVDGGTEIVGAVVATVDAKGNDLGALDLDTGTLRVEDLKDSHISRQTGFSVSAYVSVGKSSEAGEDAGSRSRSDGKGGDQRLDTVGVSATNNNAMSLSTVMGTLGEGDITVDGDSDPDLSGINRDVAETELELFAVDRTSGVNLQLDTRFLTEEGREEIKEDVKAAWETVETLGRSVKTIGPNLDPSLAEQTGKAGERAVDALMVQGGMSAAEANAFLRDNPELLSILGALDASGQALSDPAEAERQRQNEISSNEIAARTQTTIQNTLSSELTPEDNEAVIVGAELPPTAVESVGVTLGQGQRYMDDLAEENPRAATLTGLAIAAASGGPVKAAVAVVADRTLQEVAGEEIEAVEEQVTQRMGQAITFAGETQEEFAEDVALSEDGKQALIQDGSRFVLSTIFGILPGKKGGGKQDGGKERDEAGQGNAQVAQGDDPDVDLPNNKNNLDEAFHYTDAKWKEDINTNGLRKDSYATPDGNLSPDQASIELALPPNRNLPDAKLKIDLDAMRRDGFDIPQPTRVSNVVTDAKTGRTYTRPGGGYEMKFDYEIPAKYISIVE